MCSHMSAYRSRAAMRLRLPSIVCSVESDPRLPSIVCSLDSHTGRPNCFRSMRHAVLLCFCFLHGARDPRVLLGHSLYEPYEPYMGKRDLKMRVCSVIHILDGYQSDNRLAIVDQRMREQGSSKTNYLTKHLKNNMLMLTTGWLGAEQKQDKLSVRSRFGPRRRLERYRAMTTEPERSLSSSSAMAARKRSAAASPPIGDMLQHKPLIRDLMDEHPECTYRR